MKTIILPGFSVSNKEWAYEVKENLQLGHDVLVHKWKHWTSGSFSVKYETEKILKTIGKDDLNVIAKSVGARIAMHLIPLLGDQIKKIILCGIPTKFESETARILYKAGLSQLGPEQVICIQNTKDPLANYSIIKKYISTVDPKIKVIEKPRSDHHYPYTKEFESFLSS
jgi:hypothetical protein